MNLAVELAQILLTIENCAPDFGDTDVTDFFDVLEIPLDARSDYIFSVIVMQAAELLENMEK